MKVVYKFNLSAAVKETIELVNNQNWIIEICQADGKAYKDILAKALEPIASGLLGISGRKMVNNLPDVVLDWFVNTAVVFAINQGTVSESDCSKKPKFCPKKSPNYVKKEV
jgi:hypothetical protein